MYAAKAEEAEDGGYSVNHSAFEYLMSPQGENLFIFTTEVPAERIADVIREAMRD